MNMDMKILDSNSNFLIAFSVLSISFGFLNIAPDLDPGRNYGYCKWNRAQQFSVCLHKDRFCGIHPDFAATPASKIW
ncbi:MAG: hypothetical protein AMS26_22995 [Bacteroides sp. SM23_62]|nr:MAG: hypothetical protein AMS26_22995 [Bacteroides sp. SM23_62]